MTKFFTYLILITLFLVNTLFAQMVITQDKVKVGKRSSSADKYIEFDNNLGASNPKIRANKTTNKIEFSHDGTSYDPLGSGSGSGGSGVNLLTADDNNTFDEGVTGWTASGGTVTAETTTPLFGTGSLNWDASALNQTLSSTAKTPSQGLRDNGNCLASISYKYSGSSGDYKLQAYDGTNVLGELSLDSSSTTRAAHLGFSCPSSGTVLLRLIAGVADPGQITIDGNQLAGGAVHLGSNILLADFGSSEFYGSLKYGVAANCAWATTSATYADFAADADCSAPTVTGKASAPGTKIPGVTFSSVIPGEYMVMVQANFQLGSVNDVCEYRISDGTNASGYMKLSNLSNLPGNTLVGSFRYTSQQANLTFQIQAQRASGTTDNCNILAANRDEQLTFSVYRFPTQAQTALVGTETSAQSWSGYHTVASGWSVTSTTFVDPSAGTTVALTETTNRSLNCSTASGSLPGITCTLPSIGVYQVCSITTLVGSATSSYLAARLVDGSGTVIDPGHLMLQTNGNQNSVVNCGHYKNNSANGSVTFKTQIATNSESVTIQNGAITDVPAIQWTVTNIDQQFPMPLLVNQKKYESAYLKESQTSGTAGSVATAGVYNTRVINVLENPESYSWISLSSNQITLQPGTYEIDADLPVNSTGAHRARLRNITDSTTTILGTTGAAASTNAHGVSSVVKGVFTITSVKVFELQHYAEAAGRLGGIAASSGENEIYLSARITRLKSYP